MKNFRTLLLSAKSGKDEDIGKILDLYKALIYKESIINGEFDPDLNQLLYKTLFQCIMRFKK